MITEMKSAISRRKENVLDSYRVRIREKAISNAQATIALAGRKVNDYDEEQLEIIVQKEEEKIIQKYKTSVLYGALALLGIGYF